MSNVVNLIDDSPRAARGSTAQHGAARGSTGQHAGSAHSRRHADSVSLLAERRSNQIYIQIDDDGPGIPADRRTEMFQPFRRMDDARGPDTGGAGLGLTIARDVIRRHGGEIRLGASEMGGLRVELRLPV